MLVKLTVVVNDQLHGKIVCLGLSLVRPFSQHGKFLIKFHGQVLPDLVDVPSNNKGIIQDPLRRNGDALFQVGGLRQGLVNLVNDLFTIVKVPEQGRFAHSVFGSNMHLGKLPGVLLYPAGCEKLPRGPVPHRLRLGPLPAKNKDGRLVLADLPQNFYRLADGHRSGPHYDGRFISNKPSGMQNQYRPVDRQPEVPNDHGCQESSDTDPDVQKKHGGQEGKKEGEMADNYGGYSEEHPGEHTQQYPLGG